MLISICFFYNKSNNICIIIRNNFHDLPRNRSLCPICLFFMKILLLLIIGVFAEALPKFKTTTGDHERTSNRCLKISSCSSSRTSSFWRRWLGRGSAARPLEDVLNLFKIRIFEISVLLAQRITIFNDG